MMKTTNPATSGRTHVKLDSPPWPAKLVTQATRLAQCPVLSCRIRKPIITNMCCERSLAVRFPPGLAEMM